MAIVPILGFRCDWKIPAETQKCLLILSGSNVGKLVTDKSISGPALDVTELVEIVAVKPTPFLTAKMKPGMLFSHGGGFYIWFEAMVGSGAAFMCIAHTSPTKIGEDVQGLPPERLGIALSTDVRRRPVDLGLKKK
jgi:hypothetical protein